jgi:hypothetical protein
MQSKERVVIQDSAAVIIAYVLELRESSVMLPPAKNITHTAPIMTVQLLLLKGKALRHAVPATYAWTGVAYLPSAIEVLQKRTDLPPEHALLIGFPGDRNDWQPGSLSSAFQHSLRAVTRCPPPGMTWTSHSLRIGAHTKQTL